MVPSRAKAQALIMAGEVSSEGLALTKAGALIAVDAPISIREKPPFVGRGGLKLAHALEEFGVNPKGMTALDVGASTGGFTDCLLQGGARRVYALDVGRGQLDYGLRQDPRVVVMERVNAHYPFELPEKGGLRLRGRFLHIVDAGASQRAASSEGAGKRGCAGQAAVRGAAAGGWEGRGGSGPAYSRARCWGGLSGGRRRRGCVCAGLRRRRFWGRRATGSSSCT